MSEAIKVWEPQPIQVKFLERPEYEVLYGGAAGGGKSDAMLAEALRQVAVPYYRAIILRKTYPQLTQLIERSRDIYQRAFPRARYNQTEHCWTFPSGAKIYFGSMQHTKDRINYQGKQYDFVGFDELTHFTWEEYSYLFSRNRPNGPGTMVYMRATTNPGGVGHGWVKERFITVAEPMTPVKYELQVVDDHGDVMNIMRDRIFIPATVFDNKVLLKNDPTYVASLAMLPEAERKALLYGDWDSFHGQVFTEWRNDKARYYDRLWTHVIKEFEIPRTWKLFRGFDFGYSRPFSVGWYAVDHDGTMYRIAELYGCSSTPNTGVKYTPQMIAMAIRDIEANHHNIKGRKVYGIADPAIYDESGGESIAGMMGKEGVYFNPADNQRLPGKMQCHYRLAFDDEGFPAFYVFDCCTNFIRTIPNLVYSETKVEDVDTDTEDHIYDEWRYVSMESPIAPRMQQAPAPDQLGEDPLNLRPDYTRKRANRAGREDVRKVLGQ